MKGARIVIAALTLSATGFVGLVTHEGYSERAVPPVKGDVPTNGFGSTTREDGTPLQPGERTDPVRAVRRAMIDVNRFQGAVKQCVKVPLHQHEYDAYVSLAYNIGTSAFCSSTLVRKLNAEDYAGACDEILRWDRFQGKPLRGLTIRRQAEHKQCLGVQ